MNRPLEGLDSGSKHPLERQQSELSKSTPGLYRDMSQMFDGQRQFHAGFSSADRFFDFNHFNSIYPRDDDPMSNAFGSSGNRSDMSEADTSQATGSDSSANFQNGQFGQEITQLEAQTAQLLKLLMQIDQELSQFLQGLGDGSAGANPGDGSTSDSPPTSSTPTPPTSDAPPTSSTPTPPTSDSPPTSSTPTPPTSDAPPSSTTPGPNSATGPNGEVVGSTATTFGVSAMPEAAQTAPGFYVSANGSANGDGSKENPFATLQQAQKAMENSSIKTTYVEGGTYNQSSPLNLTSADSGESFIGIGSSGNQATLDGGGTSGSLISINGANNITIEGMQLQNTQKNLWAYQSADAAINATNSSGDNFSYNTIQNVGVAYNLGGVTNSKFDGNAINDVQQAIAMNPGDSNNTVDSNSITNVDNVTGGNQAGAINMEGSTNSTISNNYFNNIAASAVEMCNWSDVSPVGNTVTGNTVLNTDTAATPSSTYNSSGTNPSDMGAIYAWQGAGNYGVNLNLNISNNYIKNSGAGYENVGIYLDDGVSGATVTGNIVQSNGSGWSMLVHGGSNDTIKNNIFNLTSSTGNQHGVLMQSDGPQMNNDIISQNIFYASGANAGAYTDFSQPSNDIPQTISDNTYSGVSQSNDSSPIDETLQFADPSNGDYTLASD